jgi:hypothetical protein
VLGETRAAELAEQVQDIEDCTNIGELMRLGSQPRVSAARGTKAAKRK